MEQDEQDERDHLVRQLFFVMTVRLEDAAIAAADGQGACDPAGIAALTTRIYSVTREVAIIADAVTALVLPPTRR
jgi:hypothetical protein